MDVKGVRCDWIVSPSDRNSISSCKNVYMAEKWFFIIVYGGNFKMSNSLCLD